MDRSDRTNSQPGCCMEGFGPGDGLTVPEFHDRLFDAMAGKLQ